VEGSAAQTEAQNDVVVFEGNVPVYIEFGTTGKMKFLIGYSIT